MSKVEHPLHALKAYLPEGAFEPVLALIHQYKLHLTVTKARKSVLGDYRHPLMGANHKISVNGNLNQYEFLITLLHELGHLLCYEQYKNRVEAHGKEWKYLYGFEYEIRSKKLISYSDFSFSITPFSIFSLILTTSFVLSFGIVIDNT